MIRLLKSLIVFSAAMLCIFYAANNVANINNMFGVFSYVLSNEGHVAYPNSFGPTVTIPILIWAAMIAVLVGEFGAGLLALKGSWDLFRARGKSADEFQDAKTTALIACLVGVLTWYGLFMGIGGAYFQMWQTEIGMGSQADAFRFAAMLGIIFLIVQSRDDQLLHDQVNSVVAGDHLSFAAGSIAELDLYQSPIAAFDPLRNSAKLSVLNSGGLNVQSPEAIINQKMGNG